MHRGSDFSELYAAIEKRIKEGPIAPTPEESKSGEIAKSVTNVSASNNSIAIGSINGVSGNINIGNRDQSENK
jgi:hypothetical protein